MPPRILRVRRLDHVVLHVGSEAVLRAKHGADANPEASARSTTWVNDASPTRVADQR